MNLNSCNSISNNNCVSKCMFEFNTNECTLTTTTLPTTRSPMTSTTAIPPKCLQYQTNLNLNSDPASGLGQ